MRLWGAPLTMKARQAAIPLGPLTLALSHEGRGDWESCLIFAFCLAAFSEE